MIFNFILNIIVLILSSLFLWLPQIQTFPTIIGFDIDGMLLNGIGMLKEYMITFWPLYTMFQGFLVLVGYFLLKRVISLFLGSRA
jgi:hypothetical protein